VKRIAYYALHYGTDYLSWSIRSVQDAVDEIHVLYTPTPSFGHATDVPCPDTREALVIAAHRFARKPIHWHVGAWRGEGEHRNAIDAIARAAGAGLVLAVDSDEIWDRRSLESSLAWVEAHPVAGVSRYRVWFDHFWRSFSWVCHDPCRPERILDLRGAYGSAADLPHEAQICPVLHFGYAQREDIMRYKWRIHGHQDELRHGWLDRFLIWQPGEGDVHPTNLDFWTPVPTPPDLARLLDEQLGDHPYRGQAVIR